jgi:hypothetical protein
MRRSVGRIENQEDGVNNKNTLNNRTMRIGAVGLCLGVALSMSVAFCVQPPAVEWVQQFPGIGASEGRWVRQTSDDGFIVAGSTSPVGSDFRSALVVKTDSLGHLEWNFTFGERSAFNAVQQTSDGGYIACGDSLAWLYLVKLAADGSLEWERTFDEDSGSTNGWSVEQTSDGGYVVGADKGRMCLVRFDSLGSELWERQFGWLEYVIDEFPHALSVCARQTQDGGYILTGKADSSGLALIKVDSSGESLWARNYPDAPHPDMGMDVELTADGGYVLAGVNAVLLSEHANCKMLIMKVNANGGLVWKTKLGTDGTSIGYSVAPTSDGGYVAAGMTTSTGTREGDGYIVRTNSSGSVLWTRTYDMASLYADAACVQQTIDGGYVVTGRAGSPFSIYLLKLGSDARR